MRPLIGLCTVAALLLPALPAAARTGVAPGGVREVVAYSDSGVLKLAPLDDEERSSVGV